MSLTYGWSSALALSESVASYLRSYIYSQIVPSVFTATYEDATLEISFLTSRTTITIDTAQPDTITIVAPFSGIIQTNITDSVRGQVTLSVHVADIEIRPAPEGAGDDSGTTSWTNAAYFISQDVFSDLTVELTQGSDEDAAILTSFFSQEIQAFSSEPYLLPERSTNIEEILVPTLVRFITLTGGSSGSELLMLIMMDGQSAPTGDQHGAFSANPMWNIPAGSNAVIALGDYTVLSWFALKMEERLEENDVTYTMEVSKEPAALTGTVTKRHVTLDFVMSFTDTALKIEIFATTFFIIKATYVVTVSKGATGIVITSTLESSSIEVNQDNSVVMAIEVIQNLLRSVPVFAGQIFEALIGKLGVALKKLVNRLIYLFDFQIETKGEAESITNIILDDGIACTMELTEPPSAAATSVGSPEAQPEPAQEEAGLGQAISAVLDKLAEQPVARA